MTAFTTAPQRVVLHVGTMKSGTTTIQALLFANQKRLAEQGVLALGRRWADQVAGVQELIARPAAPGAPWQRLVEQARGWDGTSVISMEFLGPFIPRRVEAAVAGFGDLPVEVVITMRDLNRTIPSLWQEAVQNGRAWTWSDYQAGLREARPWGPQPRPAEVSEPGRTFWRQQNAVRIAGRWARVVGWDRVSLVTVPPPGAASSILVERFSRVVGFAADSLVTPPSQNAALGAVSAQLLQRVNARLAQQGMAEADAHPVRKRLLAKQVLSARRGQEEGVALDVQPWVVGTSAEMVRRLRGSGVRLEGQWDDLAPVGVGGADPEQTSEAELVAAATYGFRELRNRLEHLSVPGPLPRWPDPQNANGAIDALARLVLAAAAVEVPS